MMIIGITGPTGAGKTTALEVLGSMGFEIVDCDALYYELLRTSLPLRRALEDAFGPVFLPDGQLDRRALAARVFTAPEELQRQSSGSTASSFPLSGGWWKKKFSIPHKKGLP